MESLRGARSHEAASAQVVCDLMPPAKMVEQIPLYTFDKHTWAGKRAITFFAIECREVREALARYVPDFRARDVALMAAFVAIAAESKSGRKRRGWSRPKRLLGDRGAKGIITQIEPAPPLPHRPAFRIEEHAAMLWEGPRRYSRS